MNSGGARKHSPHLDAATVTLTWFWFTGTLTHRRRHNSRHSQQSSATMDELNTTQLTDFQVKVTVILAIVLNTTSMASCSTVLVIYFGFRRHHKSTLNRISMRLTIQAVATNILFSAGQIISDVMTTGGPLCTFSVWAYIFFDMLSIWLVTMIAFNLHVVFVNRKMSPLRFERWYFWASFILSSVAFLPLFSNTYGFEEQQRTCWYIDGENGIGTRTIIAWEFATYYVWVIIATLYSIVAILFVMYKIRCNAINLIGSIDDTWAWVRHDTPKLSSESDPEPSLRGNDVSRATMIVKRVIWYPVTLIVCNSLNLVNDLKIAATGTIFYPLYLGSFLATSSQGLLICIVFCFDPAMLHIWREKRAGLIQKYITDYDARFGDGKRSYFTTTARNNALDKQDKQQGELLSQDYPSRNRFPDTERARPTWWARTMHWFTRKGKETDDAGNVESGSGAGKKIWTTETTPTVASCADIPGRPAFIFLEKLDQCDKQTGLEATADEQASAGSGRPEVVVKLQAIQRNTRNPAAGCGAATLGVLRGRDSAACPVESAARFARGRDDDAWFDNPGDLGGLGDFHASAAFGVVVAGFSVVVSETAGEEDADYDTVTAADAANYTYLGMPASSH
ncbi:hypothetical protein BC938DRAFT_471260 [Jimgerdemannia flammicorona]|uniref:G-protein coupled receptors family 2 profile 2 domain-containing protein n=1 Tax=Jimgerdemannia flammicorona TaxID=994334 RepID=A0A433Q8E0_9FUNG|nr:hypothetical protein BC938DRAFT_471260 [Jimgerdemannia flammicorona]